MKQIFIALIAAFSVNVFAFNGPVVESVNMMTYIEPSCPVCDGGMEVTKTTFTFTEDWCRSDVSADVYEVVLGQHHSMIGVPQATVTIAVTAPIADCMGPTRPITFQLTTDQLVKGERYILTNPSVIK